MKTLRSLIGMESIFQLVSKTSINFEKLNPSISINVFSYEQEVYPLRITKKANDKTVNLLLISKGENRHYCWIKNVSRLLTSQISKK